MTMKAQDAGLLKQHQELVDRLAKRDAERTEANRRAKAARKALDEFVRDRGDVLAKQAGFLRKEAWKKWSEFPVEWKLENQFEDWFKTQSVL